MKIIDLLNKIANNEKVPKRVRYINLIWEYDDEIKDYIHDDLYLFYKINGIGLTENYVEILEEEKKIPEKLELPSFIEFKTMTPEERYVITAREYDVLNDLIDYLKSKGDD
jgi:hypothetical protein